MKQTQNAIKFLMAQYRAVFKHAYLKGLVSAAVLTAGLATGVSANAASAYNGETITGNVVIFGESSFTIDSKEYTNGGGITTSQDNKNPGIYGINFSCGSGTFNFKDSNFDVKTDDHAGYGARVGFGQGTYNISGTNTIAQQLTLDAGNNGSLTIKGEGDLIVNGYLTVSKNSGSTLDASAANIIINVGPVSVDGSEQDGGFILDQDMTIGNLTLNGASYIQLYRDDNWGETSGFKADKTLTIASGKTLKFNGQNSLVASEKQETAANSGTFSLTLSGSGDNANVAVSAGASLDLERALTIQNIDFTNEGTVNNNATFTVDESSVYTNNGVFNNTVNGELLISGSSSARFANNKTLNNSGTITVSGSGAVLNVNSGSTFKNDGTLTISGGTASFDTSVVDHIDDLGDFANSGTITLVASGSAKTFTIAGNEDLSKLLNENPDTDNDFSGALILKGVTLESTKSLELAQAEMNKFTNSSDATIHADQITYTTSGTGENLNGVTIFGDDLIFKSHTGTGPVTVSGSAASTFAGYAIKTEGSADLILKDNITLEMINQESTAQKGSIDVNLNLSGGSTKAILNIEDLEVSAKDITLSQSGDMTVSGSKFTTSLTLNGDLTVTDAASSVQVNNAQLSASNVSAGAGSISVGGKGTLTANTIDAGTGTGINLSGSSSLIIKGDSSDNSDLAITNASKIKVTNGTLNLTNANDTVGLKFNATDSTWSVNTNYDADANKIKIDGSTVVVDLSKVLAAGTSLTFADANALLPKLASGTGLIDIGQTNIVIPEESINTNPTTNKSEISADSIKDASGNVSVNVVNSQTQDLVLTKVGDGKTVTGGWEGVKTAGTGTAVNVADSGKLALYGTAANDNIVADENNNVVDLNLGSESVAEFNTTGKVGEINGANATVILSEGSNVTAVNKLDTTKQANVTVREITGTGSLTAKDVTSTDTSLSNGAQITAANYKVGANGSFDVTGLTMTVTDTLDLTQTSGEATIASSQITSDTISVAKATVDGSNVSGKTLTGSTGSAVTASNSVLTFDKVNVENLTLSENAQAFIDTFELVAGGTFRVGTDANTAAGTTDSTASAQIQTMLLKGGYFKMDPSYSQPTALATIDNLSNGNITNGNPETDVGIADGKILIGQNSALGLGVATLDELREVIAKYQVGSALDSKKYGAILYVDGALQVAQDQGITLTSQSLTSFTNNLPTALQGAADGVANNTIFFGSNTAMIINGDNNAFVNIVGNSADSDPSRLVAAGGKVIINGDIKTGEYTIFTWDDKDGLRIVNPDNTTNGAQIEVTTENELLVGYLTNDKTTTTSGKVDLAINSDKAASILNAASTPVYETILAYGRGYNGDDTTDKLYGSVDASGNQLDDYNNYFLQQELTKGNGASTEKVARLGVYGGAAQAALVAGSTTYEAVSGRMGVGAQTGNITFANNGQGAGLWLTPVYKNQDSDSFGAQGLSYGADLDLYGVALGGDLTLANGMRVGAAFNVGSGDADGQGAGAGVSNDFDYYGFTVYGGYTLDKLSIVGDISYTVVDNDVEADTQFEKVSASMDSSNLSVGVTAQYGFDYNGVSITPHAGMRYTYIDMDDYTVKGSAEIAKYEGDSMSVFSIPVGVTFSKDIAAGDWTVKPAFDLTLTANMGDDSIDGSVTWAGVNNLKTSLESEVLDSFTYGATLGVSAQNGNFSFGLGVNYTGASNADEYGVSANARFVF